MPTVAIVTRRATGLIVKIPMEIEQTLSTRLPKSGVKLTRAQSVELTGTLSDNDNNTMSG
ncbi:Tubulin beta-2 chain [Verticillium dahliae VDG1]|nr:Tubulin beta-2 chain [Verticillium dahliae VDG1]